MCFTIDDLEQYINKRGFAVDDYKELMPGVQVSDWDQFIEFIYKTIEGKDDYLKERTRAIRRFHKYADGMNTKRILDACGISLAK